MSRVSDFNTRHAGQYELFGESDSEGLYQLRYLHPERGGAAMAIGGWIHPSASLGRGAYVSGSARVHAHVRIGEHAWINSDVVVGAGAHIGSRATVRENASIGGGARVEVGAHVMCGTRLDPDVWIPSLARVSGDAMPIPFGYLDALVIHTIGSEGGTLTAYRSKDGGVTVTRGCYIGTLVEFEQAVQKVHGDNKYGREYAAAIALIRVRFEAGES